MVFTPVVAVNAQSRPGYVYDFADILFTSEEDAIEALCTDIDEVTTAEVVVVTLPDLENFEGDINKARLDYFNSIALDGVVGIGKEGEDNGVLIIVSMDEREWGIEVGYGVEGDLTDSESGRIGREVIVPNFQDGEYYYGLFIAAAVVGEELGYNVSEFETPYVPEYEEPDILDILLEDDPSMIFWWLLGMGGDVMILVIILIIIAFIFMGGGRGRGGRGWSSGGGGRRGGWGGGGGRSGGGGAKGRW